MNVGDPGSWLRASFTILRRDESRTPDGRL